VRLEPAGQPPFRFTIPYRDSDLNSWGRYAVRATLRQGERLLFTTDTITPVLEGGPQAGPQPPVTLQLVQVGSHRQLAGMFRYKADAASIRLRAGEARVLQNTAMLEAERARNPRHAEGVARVAELQRELRGDLTKLQMNNKIEAARDILLDTQDAMRDAETALFDKITGEPAQKPQNTALAQLSDLINLINEQAKRQKNKNQDQQQQQMTQQEAEMMMQMAQQEQRMGMKPGQQPGGPNQNGGNTEKASPNTAGNAIGSEAAARRTGKGSGVTRPVPTEFREALENYFKAVEAKP